jgi:hypothetical protein
MSLRHLVDSYPDEPWNDVLLRLYDMEPCGFCRGGLLDMMISRKAAPAQFLFEAQWDACQDVKSSARGAVVR